MNNRLHLAATQSSRSGFTLLELMVTMVIIGILAAIAIPAYRNYVITGNIPVATSGLSSEQVQMEQFFQDNQTYVGAPGCTNANNTTSNQYFTFSCSVTATATTYTLKAQGVGTMAAFAYTVDQGNNKTTTLTSPPSGWSGSGDTCWVTRTGGRC